MIPKIIHYCWFGHGKKTFSMKKCINTWHKKLPEFQIFEWNENNYDLSRTPKYVQDAYALKKYAFVSDYVRLDVLSKYGGIYLDTDVKILKDFSFILGEELVLCFETDVVMTAFIGSSKANDIIKQFKATYDELVFEKNDKVGYIPNTFLITNFLEKKYGLIRNGQTQYNSQFNYVVYKNEFFCAYDLKHNHPKITKNSYTVHLYENSRGKTLRERIKKFLPNILSYNLYDKIYDFYRRKNPKKDKREGM